jgi:hypothetical protein
MAKAEEAEPSHGSGDGPAAAATEVADEEEGGPPEPPAAPATPAEPQPPRPEPLKNPDGSLTRALEAENWAAGLNRAQAGYQRHRDEEKARQKRREEWAVASNRQAQRAAASVEEARRERLQREEQGHRRELVDQFDLLQETAEIRTTLKRQRAQNARRSSWRRC